MAKNKQIRSGAVAKVKTQKNNNAQLGDNSVAMQHLSPALQSLLTPVICIYTGNGPTGTLGAAWNVVKYGTQVIDSDSAYNTSTGIYTVSTPGNYYVDGKFLVNGTFSANQQIGCAIYVNGSAFHGIIDRIYGAPSDVTGRCFGLLPNLSAGDTIEIRSYCSGSGLSFGTGVATNNFTLHKVGA